MRAAAADAMLGSVGNGALPGGSPPGRRSGWNRLGPAAPVRGTPPRRLEPRDGGWGPAPASRPKLWGARARAPGSWGLKTLQGPDVRGTL